MFVQKVNGQTLYSYIDENGIQVFTNVAPVDEVWNLKVTGSNSPPTQSTPENQLDAFNSIIEKYASHYELPPSLIRSIIETESGFNPRAVSPKGAQGLMQLMPETAERLGVSNSFDPEQNIHGGVKYFRFLMDIFDGDIELSLAAYNAGENLVKRLGRVPSIKETREYVRSVKRLYDKSEFRTQSQKNSSQTYRYLDESGVLHLTNIPPLR